MAIGVFRKPMCMTTKYFRKCQFLKATKRYQFKFSPIDIHYGIEKMDTPNVKEKGTLSHV
jgi:hypothetical protein